MDEKGNFMGLFNLKNAITQVPNGSLSTTWYLLARIKSISLQIAYHSEVNIDYTVLDSLKNSEEIGNYFETFHRNMRVLDKNFLHLMTVEGISIDILLGHSTSCKYFFNLATFNIKIRQIRFRYKKESFDILQRNLKVLKESAIIYRLSELKPQFKPLTEQTMKRIFSESNLSEEGRETIQKVRRVVTSEYFKYILFLKRYIRQYNENNKLVCQYLIMQYKVSSYLYLLDSGER